MNTWAEVRDTGEEDATLTVPEVDAGYPANDKTLKTIFTKLHDIKQKNQPAFALVKKTDGTEQGGSVARASATEFVMRDPYGNEVTYKLSTDKEVKTMLVGSFAYTSGNEGFLVKAVTLDMTTDHVDVVLVAKETIRKKFNDVDDEVLGGAIIDLLSWALCRGDNGFEVACKKAHREKLPIKLVLVVAATAFEKAKGKFAKAMTYAADTMSVPKAKPSTQAVQAVQNHQSQNLQSQSDSALTRGSKTANFNYKVNDYVVLDSENIKNPRDTLSHEGTIEEIVGDHGCKLQLKGGGTKVFPINGYRTTQSIIAASDAVESDDDQDSETVVFGRPRTWLHLCRDVDSIDKLTADIDKHFIEFSILKHEKKRRLRGVQLKHLRDAMLTFKLHADLHEQVHPGASTYSIDDHFVNLLSGFVEELEYESIAIVNGLDPDKIRNDGEAEKHLSAQGIRITKNMKAYKIQTGKGRGSETAAAAYAGSGYGRGRGGKGNSGGHYCGHAGCGLSFTNQKALDNHKSAKNHK